jgi:DNA-binding winged helix-turn-helix (wHTH) protein
MSETELNGVGPRARRRWHFADCVFDEASWSLSVDGRRVAIEIKPLEILRVLLVRAGDLVSKSELLDLIWPDVMVVEASLPTAVHKLRLALNDSRADSPIVETVSRVGYRLAVPVRTEETSPAAPLTVPVSYIAARSIWRSPFRLLSILGGLIFAVWIASLIGPVSRLQATRVNSPYSQREARDALRRLDVRAIERMRAVGWDPNLSFDDQGNGAINYVLNQCEWDRGHNQEQILLMVRTLTDDGAVIDRRNIWGDTPYSIASAKRYCGPDHPVTRYLRMLCMEGTKPLGDRCMASYELARGHHFKV